MTDINRLLSINTIGELLKYEIPVKTFLVVAVLSSLVLLVIIIYFGGVKNIKEYCRLKLNLFLDTYVVKDAPVDKV